MITSSQLSFLFLLFGHFHGALATFGLEYTGQDMIIISHRVQSRRSTSTLQPFPTTYLAITDGCLRFSFPGGGKSCSVTLSFVIEIKKEVNNKLNHTAALPAWCSQDLEFYTGWGEANQEIWLWMKYQIHSNKYWAGDDEIIASEPVCSMQASSAEYNYSNVTANHSLQILLVKVILAWKLINVSEWKYTNTA